MHENHMTIREEVPVADIRAGDWILTPDEEDQGVPEQLLWRFGQRSPDGEFRWSFKTTAGVRHFDQGATLYRVTSAGQKRLDEIRSEMHQASDTIVGNFTDEELIQLRHLCLKLVQNMYAKEAR